MNIFLTKGKLNIFLMW